MTVIDYFSKKLPREPRGRFAALEALGYAPLFTLVQKHGDTIIRLRKPYTYPGLDALIANQPEGDAVVTDQPGLFVGVKTADCVPILLWDGTAGVAAAVHAGWRGTAARIVQKTVRVMRDEFSADNIYAKIGPCVCKQCYVTGRDVPDAMPPEASAHIEHTGGGRYLVDLRRINAALLREEGVLSVDIHPGCTACDPASYWSHRVHGAERGLQVSLIGIQPDKEIVT